MMSLTDTNREALERSLTVARSESPARARQLASILSDRSWEEVARFASYSAQVRLLHLQPRETPPIWIGRDNIDAALNAPDDPRYIPGTARLLKRMIDAGLSRFEPDPIAALERVEARHP